MYKATRMLIEARQKYSPFEVTKIMNVRKTGGGVAAECFLNACAEQTHSGAKVVSGWLVDRYNAAGGYTEITQHWWNVDAAGRHYDTTPNVDDEFEYVMDPAICVYGQIHMDKIQSCICSSLVLKNDNTFLAINLVNSKLVATPITDVSNESLFAHQLILQAA